MNILIVDDEPLLVKGLKNSFANEGYNVYTAYDGMEALYVINNNSIDFIILDLMMPEMDGITLCKKIRETKETPIIMLTAKSDYVDKILGLEIGADDYITKPFHARELIARVKAISRRIVREKTSGKEIKTGNIVINLGERNLYKSGIEIKTTSKEFDILQLLASNSGMVFTREKIYEMLWNEIVIDTRTVDVHVSNLRDKIEDDPSKPQYIRTKWGAGYYFRKESK